VEGRQRRFRWIFEGCFAPVNAYVRRRVGPQDVDDIVAEVFTVAWRRLDDIPPEVELPWLYGVARRTVANHRRAEGRRQRLAERVAAHVNPVAVAGEEYDDDLLAALFSLGEAERELIRLAAWEDLDAAGIAVVLGCSPNAAALRLSRARRRLRASVTSRRLSRTQTTVKDLGG
jgi:RNA polymerase sigma factor (sigma-70 family)